MKTQSGQSFFSTWQQLCGDPIAQSGPEGIATTWYHTQSWNLISQ